MPELAALIIAASLGSMLFFSSVTAPTVFRVLAEQDGGLFLRALFPKYFLVNGLMAIVAALIAMRPTESAILAACGSSLLIVRYYAIPRINLARDAMVAGDAQAAERFARWHRGAVVVNSLEMIALLGVIYLLLAI